MRKQNERYYLEKALEWFKSADEWSQGIDDQAHSALSSLADTYFHLNRWQDAHTTYKRLSELHIKLRDGEDCPEIDKKISECERNLHN